MAAAARVPAAGEKEGEEEQQVAGELLILQRGGQARGGRGGGATAMAIVAAVLPLSPQEEDPDRWVPLSGSSPFIFFYFQNQQGFGIYLRPQTIF